MGQTRKQHGAAFKAKVALEAIKEIKSLNEIAATYGVHRVQICKWKKQLLESVPSLFKRENKGEAEWIKERDNLYRQIGEMTVERDWLKKNCKAWGRCQTRID